MASDNVTISLGSSKGGITHLVRDWVRYFRGEHTPVEEPREEKTTTVDYDTLEGMEAEVLRLIEYDGVRQKNLHTSHNDRNITTTLDINVRKLDFILQDFANSIHPGGDCSTGYCLFRGYSPVNGWTPKLLTRQGYYFKLWNKYKFSDGIETSVVWLLQAVLIISDIVGRDISAYDLISGIHDSL